MEFRIVAFTHESDGFETEPEFLERITLSAEAFAKQGWQILSLSHNVTVGSVTGRFYTSMHLFMQMTVCPKCGWGDKPLAKGVSPCDHPYHKKN